MLTKLLRLCRMLCFSCRTLSCLLMTGPVALVTAHADTINGAVSINWNPNYLYGGSSYVPGLYYWNNNSGDGPQANIGWCLVGGSECGMKNAPGHIPFYGTSSLTAPTNLFFSSTAGQPMQVTLDLTMTNQKNGGSGLDFFGYYLTNQTGTQINSPTILFNSNQALGSTAILSGLSAGESYAFFIENVQGYGTNAQQTTYTYYMNSSDNSANGSMPADALQHLAVFQTGTTFYIGSVDGDACAGSFTVYNSPCIAASQFDYNDMVVQLSPAVPEPIPSGLFALGIAVLGIAARLRSSRFSR